MIISHKYKFIFIKTNKTAGTSVEIALSKYCTPGDIITPISDVDESHRKELNYLGAQNYKADIKKYNLFDFAKFFLMRKEKMSFYNHMSASEVKALVGEDVWSNYYKFCIERNPYDKLASHYYWVNRKEPRPAFAEYFNSKKPKILKTRGIDLYTIDGEVVLDKICKYENLKDELEEVRTRLGIPCELELPMAKSGFKKKPYKELIGEQEKKKIVHMFEKELQLFNYSF